jgi:hypothetical protein
MDIRVKGTSSCGGSVEVAVWQPWSFGTIFHVDLIHTSYVQKFSDDPPLLIQAVARDQPQQVMYCVSDLQPGQLLFLRVRAKNAEGASSWTPFVKHCTATEAPDPPKELLVCNATCSTFAVSWSTPRDNGSKITQYMIQYRPMDATFVPAATFECSRKTSDASAFEQELHVGSESCGVSQNCESSTGSPRPTGASAACSVDNISMRSSIADESHGAHLLCHMEYKFRNVVHS